MKIYTGELLTDEDKKRLKSETKKRRAAFAATLTGLMLFNQSGQAKDKKDISLEKSEEILKDVVKEKPEETDSAKENKEEVLVYSSKESHGEHYTESGKELGGTLTQEECDALYHTSIRPVSSKNITKRDNVRVVDDVLIPYLTYHVDKGKDVFSPKEGRVVMNEDNVLVIESVNNKVKHYTHLIGLSANLSVGDLVTQGQLLGVTSSDNLHYGTAKQFDGKEVYEYFHPANAVDNTLSDTYKYNQYKYDNKEEAKVAQHLEDKLNSGHTERQSSRVLRGVEIDKKQQLALLNSSNDFYYEGTLPVQFLENGKADVSKGVRELEPLVRKAAKEHGIESMTEFLLALLQQESGGDSHILNTDPFQSSQSLTGKIGSITDQQKSINQGVLAFKNALDNNNAFNSLQHNDMRMVVQTYNFGNGLASRASNHEVDFSVAFIQESAKEFLDNAKKNGTQLYSMQNEWRGEYAYGDFTYVAKIFSNYTPEENWEKKSEEVKLKEREEIKAKEEEEDKKYKEEKEKQKKEAEAIERLREEASKPPESETDIQFRSSIASEQDRILEAYASKEEEILAINDINGPVVSKPSGENLLKGKKIAVDAGHGNNASDAGALAYNGGPGERDIAFQVSKKLVKLLKEQGAEVVETRPEASSVMDINPRRNFIQNSGADLGISIHLNSVGNLSAELPSGFETLYYGGQSENLGWAKSVNNALRESVGQFIPERPLQQRGNVGVLRPSGVPMALAELGFMAHPYDYHLVSNEHIQDSIVNAIVKNMINYFGIEEEPLEEEVPEEELDKEEVEEVEDLEDESKVDEDDPEEESSEEVEETNEKDETKDEEVKELEDDEGEPDETDNKEEVEEVEELPEEDSDDEKKNPFMTNMYFEYMTESSDEE